MNKKGFTLIEMLVVIAIIGIVASMYVPYYSKSMSQKALFFAQKQVINSTRSVKDYSFRVLKHNTTFPEGGYGIYFVKNSNKYTVFADNNPIVNGIYDPGEMYQAIELPQNVSVSEISRDSDSSILNEVNIVFKPPYGEVYFDGLEEIDEIITITVMNDRGDSKNIIIQGTGLIE